MVPGQSQTRTYVNFSAKTEQRSAIKVKFFFPNGQIDRQTISVNGKPFLAEFDKANGKVSLKEVLGERNSAGKDAPIVMETVGGMALETKHGKVEIRGYEVTFAPSSASCGGRVLPKIRIDAENEDVSYEYTDGKWGLIRKTDETVLSLIALGKALDNAAGMKEGLCDASRQIFASIAKFLAGYIQSYFPNPAQSEQGAM